MIKLEDLATICKPTWCPGCGDFGIWGAFKNACVKEGWDNTNTVITAGIGCHGHINNYTKITSFESLHGRAIPLATGVKIANHKLNVFVFTGDGDCLAEGGNHFIHASRRNHNITVIIHNNGVYGLTVSQTSPTSPLGFKSKSTPEGNPDYPLNPLSLALSAGATFVSRGFAADIPGLTDLIIKANRHQGFSVIEVLQPCLTFNKDFSPQFFQENCYKLDEKYDSSDKIEAFKKCLKWVLPAARLPAGQGRQGPKQIPLGVIYEEDKPSYESQISQIKERPLIENSLERNLEDLFKTYS